MTPRFAITSSEAQLKLSGELLAGLSGARMLTDPEWAFTRTDPPSARDLVGKVLGRGR